MACCLADVEVQWCLPCTRNIVIMSKVQHYREKQKLASTALRRGKEHTFLYLAVNTQTSTHQWYEKWYVNGAKPTEILRLTTRTITALFRCNGGILVYTE